jgi:sulfide:quinone oxidoreductase
VQDEDAEAFGEALTELPGPVLAYCRTGTRSATLWSLGGRQGTPCRHPRRHQGSRLRHVGRGAPHRQRRQDADRRRRCPMTSSSSAAVRRGSPLPPACSPRADRHRHHRPADVHYYQPGWTMVGGGIFEPQSPPRPWAALIPRGVHWIKAAVSAFEPKDNALILDGCRVVKYNRLIVAPGLKLDWDAVEGLVETLGRNGVTSNYRYDLAPYTWELVQGMKGRAIFTQPPMPIKCAGAPQKALYLSAITGTARAC